MKYYECDNGEHFVNLSMMQSIHIHENKNKGEFEAIASPNIMSDMVHSLGVFKSLEEAKNGVAIMLDDQKQNLCSHASDAKIFLSHAIEFLAEIQVESNGGKLSLQIAERLIEKALTVLEANDGVD